MRLLGSGIGVPNVQSPSRRLGRFEDCEKLCSTDKRKDHRQPDESPCETNQFALCFIKVFTQCNYQRSEFRDYSTYDDIAALFVKVLEQSAQRLKMFIAGFHGSNACRCLTKIRRRIELLQEQVGALKGTKCLFALKPPDDCEGTVLRSHAGYGVVLISAEFRG